MDDSRDGGGTGRVTIRNVAADAGVSVAAVSKVLRNAYGVSDALRGKVEQSIEKLGYRPSTAARGMRGQTYSVGVLLVEMRNAFLPSVVDGVQAVLRQNGYQALIGVGEAKAAIEQSLIDQMIDLRMDGVLLVAPRLSGERLARHAARVPMVVIGHHEPAADLFDTVNSDDVAGARLAVEGLLAKGHRDIGMVSLVAKPTAHDVYAAREAGYRQALAEAGLGDRVRVWRLQERAGQPGAPVEAFLDDPARPRAVFCWSDIAAIEVLNRAAERGIAVPDELAIVGYDDTPTAALPLIGLSSVNQRGAEIGRAAAEALLSRIGGRRVPEHRLIAPELVLRRSS